MIDLGLSAAELADFHRLLVTSHFVKVRVQILDLEHKFISDESHRLVDGMVTVDSTADVTRSLDLTLNDPNHTLHLDSESPEGGAVWGDRMVRIVYMVAPPDQSRWYRVPCFTGPIDSLVRNDSLIDITALGKEKLLSDPPWGNETFTKGYKKTDLINYTLILLGGEALGKMDIPDLPGRIPRTISMSQDAVPWEVAKSVGKTAGNRQLFYDGRGVVHLRQVTRKSKYTFSTAVQSVPQVNFDLQDFHNCVHVIGGKPKGSKSRVEYRLVAPRSSALSPYRLGRNSIPRYVPLIIQDDSIRTKSECKAVAKHHLEQALSEAVNVTFDSATIPHLEENDYVRLSTDTYALKFKLQQFTIPLIASTPANIGYLKRTNPKARALRTGWGRA